MTCEAILVRKTPKPGGTRNAYETTFYHGLLLSNGVVLRHARDEERAISSGESLGLELIHNCAARAPVVQPIANLIFEASVAPQFESLPRWSGISIEKAAFVQAPLEDFSLEQTRRYRENQVWPEALMLQWPRILPDHPVQFRLLISPMLRDLSPILGVGLQSVQVAGFGDSVDLPSDSSFLEQVPAFGTGLAFVLVADLWRANSQLFDRRYWSVFRLIYDLSGIRAEAIR